MLLPFLLPAYCSPPPLVFIIIVFMLHLDSSSSRPELHASSLALVSFFTTDFSFLVLVFPVLNRMDVDSRLLSGSLLGGFALSLIPFFPGVSYIHAFFFFFSPPQCVSRSSYPSSSSSSFSSSSSSGSLGSSASRVRSQRETPLRPSHAAAQIKESSSGVLLRF